MPELPEAETIARSLRPRIVGSTIREARFLAPRVSKDDPAALSDRVIRDVRRHGKRVLIELDRGLLLVKLGMTGSLLVDRAPGPYTRAVFDLDGGMLLFDDIRQFGSVRLLDAEPTDLGPDPLEISPDDFVQRLRVRRVQVKRLLLDQSFLRGIGNIYADEALFRAGIHPASRSERLRRDRALRLHGAIVDVLGTAIEYRGSSISDYVDAAGEKGGFQALHQVYGREDEPCVHCGSPIRRIVLAQRGTHFCPKCQAARPVKERSRKQSR